VPTTSYPWFLGETDHDWQSLSACIT
jgi:hypothetical protein